MKKTLVLLGLLSAATISRATAQTQKNFISNPIVSGYFADATIVKDKDTYYIYATIDPWGADELAVLQTKDFNDNPILSTTPDSTTYGPGHHTVFREGKQDYILYHRLKPNKEKAVLRQLCIDSLNYNADGSIKKIIPKGVSSFIKASTARK
ncbi:glycosyl hydrolase family 43 [Arcticibacter pallidicorallinus]|uniref:Glycosyl hydrolase family 43 n=1 Tax=Arcticibacter pallidicorallinus TaxID=1259464 RepID=A0A2T0U5Y3_9SPHI|nr:family 43 glycosylhydrolase [Arcticibacter pallidicorallinus]PRY53320.1 glycosyl hydrolase family 43 [Arcticibacter pallidicorallinus]